MKNIFSLNDNWKFRRENESKLNVLEDYFDMFRSNVKTGISSDERGFIFDEDWDVVNLPHDWSLADKASCKIIGNSQGHKPQGVAWYRKAFTLGDEFDGKRLFLKFDAIAINSQIWFNSIKIAESESGYTPIIVEITDFVEINRQNILSVKTDNRIKEGWWYEGGGIYANVSLIATEESFIKPYGVFVKPQKEDGNRWKIYVETDVEINSDLSLAVKCDELSIIEERIAENINYFVFDTKNPRLWSCENPNLYTMTVTLLKNSEVIDKEDVRFGFRWTEFDSEKGCFINGNSVKLKGVCIHHDFAGIGVALNEEAQSYRIKRLKEMGCNAIRTSHNPQLEAFYKICDEEGILVMDEVRHFSSTDECMHQLEVLIKRDRNHPSVIMWSMYNEELLQCTKTGEKMARKMKTLIERLDGSRPVTGGTNGPLESEGVVNVVDIMGFNYMQYAYDYFHKIFPKLPILGSETSSYMTTRGITENELKKTHACCFGTESIINLYPWASTTGDTWKYINERDFVMGGFDWTGFDYRGECGKYPATVCNFGAMDLCGFPKDSYYWHKVIWREEAQIYLSSAWNGTEGENTKFACYSNCERVVIKVNGDIVYNEAHDKYKSVIIDTVYYDGVIEALGYIDGEIAANDKMNSFGKANKIVLDPHKSTITKNDKDLCFIVVHLEDECGNTVLDANNFIKFKINENGKILGVGNGDNCFPNEENVPYVNLFNGYGLVVIAAELNYGEIVLEAESEGIENDRIIIQIEKTTENCRHIESEKLKIKQTFWQQTDVFAESITERVLNEPMFAWSPTVVGYGENIKFSGENGYGGMCTKFGVTDSMRGRNIKLCFEKVCGEFDLYIGKKFIGTFKDVENAGFDVPGDVGELVVSVIFKLSGGKCGIPGLVYLDVE